MTGFNPNLPHQFGKSVHHVSGDKKDRGAAQAAQPEFAGTDVPPRAFEDKTSQLQNWQNAQALSGANKAMASRIESYFSGDFHKKANQFIDVAAKEFGLDPNSAKDAELISQAATDSLLGVPEFNV